MMLRIRFGGLLRNQRLWPLYQRNVTTIAIRCEDKERRWERRTPILPEKVKELSQKGVKVLVESCEKRIISDKEFELAGAEIMVDLNEMTAAGVEDLVILGIKEIPISKIQSNVTYAFFSHTHKGQPSNLPLLDAMLKSGSRFIDYELLTDEEGKRTCTFGWMAGAVGMCEGLNGLAIKALAEGSALPLLQLPRPFQTRDLVKMRLALKRVGLVVKERGTGRALGPITIALTGKGRVGEGAKNILDELGVEWVSLEGMKKVVESINPNLNTIYACHLDLSDYLLARDGSPFNREIYRSRPDLFVSSFDTKVAPYTTLFVNGGFWESGCPRILTTKQLAGVKASKGGATRMLSIVDIACDFNGGLEFIKSATTIDDPTVNLDASTGIITQGSPTAGTVQLNSIEILPSELPLDASTVFATAFAPYIDSLISDPKSTSSNPYSTALKRATIVENGKLTKAYEGLYELLESATIETKKKVLMLGSGLVAGPAVAILKKRSDVELVIASNVLASAQALAIGSKSVTAILLDAADSVSLERLVKDADVVLSLLPAPLHVEVAELCIKHKSDFVSASYVSEEMAKLDERAKAAGIVLLNELGLDPGIDHMSAMRLIDEAISEGKQIKSFISFCGGLPAPEDSTGPLGYKFSWSPRGVLTAALNSAKFRIQGQEISIPGKDLLIRNFDSVPIIKGFNLEGVANRDSIKYLAEYGLQEDLGTILRGTLRYSGFCGIVDVWKKMGLLEIDGDGFELKNWEDLVDLSLGKVIGKKIVGEEMRREAIISLGASSVAVDKALMTLNELGLLPGSESAISISPSVAPLSSLDHLSNFLAAQLAYAPTERDIVILHHELGIVSSTGLAEVLTSTMVQYGTIGGDSAMASTVGMPIALGALLCLDGRITGRGIVSPASREVYIPLLEELEKEGIVMKEGRKSMGVKDFLKVKA